MAKQIISFGPMTCFVDARNKEVLMLLSLADASCCRALLVRLPLLSSTGASLSMDLPMLMVVRLPNDNHNKCFARWPVKESTPPKYTPNTITNSLLDSEIVY
eukprot:364410-Chlamydomonas_euryale.AAC.7